MTFFATHPVSFFVEDWLLIACAMFVYFHTEHFYGTEDGRAFSQTWKVVTALLWPVCLVVLVGIYAITAIVVTYELLFKAKKNTADKDESPPL